MSKKDNLGDRMKEYESVSFNKATRRTPLMIRVDGRAFHTFTKKVKCKKPFDPKLIKAMVGAATYVAGEMQGFKAAYIQSDEVTFCLTDYDTIETNGWFGYEFSKIISITASMMSVAFNKYYVTDDMWPVFDARAFNIPDDEVSNNFLWRAKDWHRNSLQMYCRLFFSHKQLHGKKRDDMHDMLHKINKNWVNDLTSQERNGTFLLKTKEGISTATTILPTFDCISREVDPLVRKIYYEKAGRSNKNS
jgi:tRNA(His) guanylyltransferase